VKGDVLPPGLLFVGLFAVVFASSLEQACIIQATQANVNPPDNLLMKSFLSIKFFFNYNVFGNIVQCCPKIIHDTDFDKNGKTSNSSCMARTP
jgi:hypothetical protein